MTTRLTTLCFDANDPKRLARFWATALSWDIEDETRDEVGLIPPDGTPFVLLFLPLSEPKAGKNRIHLDLVSESPDHETEMVDRLIAHGASRIDIGQGEVEWTVLADPEGNKFCVLTPR